MLIDRLFVPSNCVQGGELPIYLLWPKDRELEIEIQLPTKFEILEIYNAQKPRIMEGNILRATEFEENGYLGLLVKTPRLDEHTKDTEILFEIISPDGQRQQEKKIVHLFRQSVKVILKHSLFMIGKVCMSRCHIESLSVCSMKLIPVIMIVAIQNINDNIKRGGATPFGIS